MIDLNARFLRLLGGIAVSIVGLQICRKVLPWIYTNIIAPRFLGPSVNIRTLGDWAVVTGATDGIGKAYAKELAKKGLNVVLISRSLDKLETVAKEIRDEHKVEVRIVDVDFTHGPVIYDKIRKEVDDIDIGVLVNNVGISYAHPEYFLECYNTDPTFLRNIIAANIHSVTHMCALILPKMVIKRKGVIINLSSTAGVIPNPLLSVYSATKAFVNKFSDDLQTEYQDLGIIIQSVQPGFVATNMTKIRKPSLFAPSPETYVKSALSTLGHTTHTAGYLPHALLQLVIHFTEAMLGERIARKIVLNNLLATRKRALRNLAKKQ